MTTVRDLIAELIECDMDDEIKLYSKDHETYLNDTDFEVNRSFSNNTRATMIFEFGSDALEAFAEHAKENSNEDEDSEKDAKDEGYSSGLKDGANQARTECFEAAKEEGYADGHAAALEEVMKAGGEG